MICLRIHQQPMKSEFIYEVKPQIQRLLSRYHKPIVTKRRSKLVGNAGIGVFTTTSVVNGEALCLYPGVYCPGIPVSMLHSVANSAYGDDHKFLGHKSTPSGIPLEENAYILNVQTLAGGYIDGMALEVLKGRDNLMNDSLHESSTRKIKRLDSNPSCCGHLINHSIIRQNVQVLPFMWSDVVVIDNIHDCNHNVEPAYIKETLSSIPNVIRQDGAPRCLFNGDVIHYATIDDNISPIDKLYGAVIYATQNIGPDQELFLDYKLNPPLPLWAKPWYDNAQ